MTRTLEQSVENLRAGFKDSAIVIVQKTLPGKCIHLTKLMKSAALTRGANEIRASFTAARENNLAIISRTTPATIATTFDIITNNNSNSTSSSRLRKRKLSGSSSDNDNNGSGSNDNVSHGISKKAKANHMSDDTKATLGSSTVSTSVTKSLARVPFNEVIREVVQIVKKELLEFVDIVNTVRIWIQLNIPRIEDGNNFGVSVQEEALSEVGRAEDTTFSALDNITKYYVTRAKLITKTLKYPNITDYTESVHELDEKQYMDLRLAIKDLRNNSIVLSDMISKNLDKIVKPRSSHTSQMF